MKSILLVLAALMLTVPLHAALISYDGADYPANSGLNTRNGGTGWFDAWSGANSAAADGLRFPGLVTTANRFLTEGNNLATFRTPNPAGFEALLAGGSFGLDDTELWLSCLVRRETNFTTAEHAGLSLFNGNIEELFVGVPAGATRWSLQLFDLGAAPGNITPAANAPIATGDTTLLVLRFQFGVSGTQDRVDLFVNPALGVVPATPDATHTGADLLFDRIRIQSGPVALLAPMSLDEIRLGQTYADVTPSVNGPAVAWLRSGSQRVTAGAEITLPLFYAWPDGDATTLGFALTAADPVLLPPSRIVVTGTGSNRRVTFRPAAGVGGTTLITVTITPPGGTAVSASFDLIIRPTPPDGLLAYEPFDYSADERLSASSGGQGFSGAWSASLPGAVGSDFTIGTSSLASPGLSVDGAHTRTPGSFAQAEKRTLALPIGEDGTVRYMSLVVRLDGAPGATYFGLRLLGGASQDLLAGKPGAGSSLAYVLEDVGGARQVATTRAVVPGQVSLLVLKLEARPGPDCVSLFVNPPLAVEPAVADAVKEDLDLGLILGTALYGNAAWSADELRVGTTFASVTPPAADFELRRPLSENVFEHIQVTRQIETVAPLPAGRTLTFELVGESFSAQINPATGEFTWVPGELEHDQQRVFTVRATSNATPAATAETSFFLNVQEGNLPPQLEAIGDQEVIVGSSLAYQLRAIDPDVPEQNLSFSVLVGPQGLSVSSTGLLTWSPTTAHHGSSFPVTVLVIDTATGRAERSFTVTVLARTSYFAKWIGTTEGDWHNPGNWDIGRVPNNTPTEFFHVFWDAHPVTIHVAGDIAVSGFYWRGGGTLDLQSSSGNLDVQGDLFWTGGTVSGQGRMTVHGRAELAGRPLVPLTLRDQCRLILRNFSELETPLRFDGDVSLVVEPTATLGVPGGGGFMRMGGVPELRNEGRISIWSSPELVPFIFLRNLGTVTVFASTLEFQTGAATDLIQERGGSLSLGAGIGDGATINGKVVFNEGSTVVGEARIREAHIEGRVQGRLSFDQLSLGPTATSTFDLVGPRDRLSAQHPVALDGRLELRPLRGFTPGPDDVFDIMTANGGITGQFSGAPFGQRVQLPFGTGSFLLTRSADSRSVLLSRFLPPAIGIESAPLTFRLPEVEGELGGCFVVPHPAIILPAGNWAGRRLEVAITGFDLALDRLEFRPNPAFPEADDIGFEGPPDGLTVSFQGTVFGTARIVGGLMTCLLDVTAQNDAIVALLGRLYYGNSELTPDWFTAPERHYPARTIDITLTDALGMENRVSREVEFPFLVGIRLDESLLLPWGQRAVLHLQGVFSGGQVLPVRKLDTVWSENCGSGVVDPVRAGAPEGFPGQQNIRGIIETYCCTVSAASGFLRANIRIYEGTMRRATELSPVLVAVLSLFGVDALDSSCPILYANLHGYFIPECGSTPGTPGARASLHDVGNGQTPVQSPTTFYALEALMKGTAAGRRWVDLYRQHGAEVVRVFLSHPSVMTKSQELVTAFFPGVTALLAGKGDEVMIYPAMIAKVNAFWNALASYASPALKTVLEQEQARFDNFQRFEDDSFSQWAGVLGIPILTQPRLHIALARREADRFHLALNDLPGVDLSLWRSLDLKTWERVTNAEVLRDGFTRLFTDPAPPAEKAFYEIRQ